MFIEEEASIEYLTPWCNCLIENVDLDNNRQTPTDITAMRRMCTMDIVTSLRQSTGF